MGTSIEFVLGDKLPWLHEAVLAIYSYAPGGSPKEGKETKIRKKTVNAYISSVTKIWVKAFGSENIAPLITIAKKIRVALPVFCAKDVQFCRKENVYANGENLQM